MQWDGISKVKKFGNMMLVLKLWLSSHSHKKTALRSGGKTDNGGVCADKVLQDPVKILSCLRNLVRTL